MHLQSESEVAVHNVSDKELDEDGSVTKKGQKATEQGSRKRRRINLSKI